MIFYPPFAGKHNHNTQPNTRSNQHEVGPQVQLEVADGWQNPTRGDEEGGGPDLRVWKYESAPSVRTGR